MSVKYKKAYDILDDKKIVGYVERHYERSGLLSRCRYRAWLYCKGGVDEFLLEQETIKRMRYHLNARGYRDRKCEGLEQVTRWQP